MKTLPKYVAFMLFAIGESLAYADWAFKADNAGYFTDDVALFSATRRLSLKDDPTQPKIDKNRFNYAKS